MATPEDIAYLSDIKDMATAAKPCGEGNFALFGGESEDGHVVIMDGGSKPSDMRKKDDFSVPDGWLMELPGGGCVWLERTGPGVYEWKSHDNVYVLNTNAAWHLRFEGRDLVCYPSIDYDHDSHLEFVDNSSSPALTYRLARGSRIAFNTDIEYLGKYAKYRIVHLEPESSIVTAAARAFGSGSDDSWMVSSTGSDYTSTSESDSSDSDTYSAGSSSSPEYDSSDSDSYGSGEDPGPEIVSGFILNDRSINVLETEGDETVLNLELPAACDAPDCYAVDLIVRMELQSHARVAFFDCDGEVAEWYDTEPPEVFEGGKHIFRVLYVGDGKFHFIDENVASSLESRIMALESSVSRMIGGDISVMEYGNPKNLHRILAVLDPETGKVDLGVE